MMKELCGMKIWTLWKGLKSNRLMESFFQKSIATTNSLKNKLRNLKMLKDILSIARLIQLRKHQTYTRTKDNIE